MPPITVMLKPASGSCNMRCRYCFYTDETEKRSVPSYGIMTEDTLKAILSRTLSFATSRCTIAFQGGEPTLAGLPFFQKAVALEKELNQNRCRIENVLQTNGLLLDDEWCEFFAENHFLIGISLDGTKDIHDKNRLDAQGNGTYSRVMEAIRLLKKHGVEFNILTVVTRDLCRASKKVYHFYVQNKLEYQQYIPCLDPLEEPRGTHPWSLTPESYEQHLKTLFDCWYQDLIQGKKRYHRYFDNLLLIMDGQMPEACGMKGVCGRQFVVEADGSVYPCDFYMLDRYRLGNLTTDTFRQIEQKREQLGFIQESAVPHKDCLSCKWASLCRGGCRRDREPFESGANSKNYYCKAYYHFFEYAYPRLQKAYSLLTKRF